MAIAANDVLKCVWKANHTSPNTIIENVFWYQITDVVDPADNVVAGDLEGALIAMYTQINALFADRYVLDSIRITNETKKEFVSDGPGAGFAGIGGVGEVFPAQDCALVVARSRKLGHQGRKYIGPLLENTMENGALGAGAQAAMNLFATDYETTFNGPVSNNEYTPGTATVAVGGAVTSFTPFEQTLAGIEVNARTQRRRRPGVGLG